MTASGPSGEMLQLLVESIVDYAIVFLDNQGNILSWNSGAERMQGWRGEEIIGENFERFYPPEPQTALAAAGALTAAARDGRFEDEGWRVRKDGSRFWANVVLTALRDSHGARHGFGAVIRDLTDRRRQEEEIRRQDAEILEMATVPVVQVWEGLVLAPLIGPLDTERSQHLMENLLARIADTGSRIALLDITGVHSIDTQTAQHLIETIAAVRLLGAEVILTGVRPAIAQTLVHLGIELNNVSTRASLSAGLHLAFTSLNLTVSPRAVGAAA